MSLTDATREQIVVEPVRAVLVIKISRFIVNPVYDFMHSSDKFFSREMTPVKHFQLMRSIIGRYNSTKNSSFDHALLKTVGDRYTTLMQLLILGHVSQQNLLMPDSRRNNP